MTLIKLVLMLWLHAIVYWMLSWSPQKRGRDPVGAEGTSHTVFLGWKSVQSYCVLV